MKSAADDAPRLILIVDDDASARLVTQTVLEKAGLRVICAAHGDDAVDKLRAFRPDGIVLDVVMPRENGFEVCRRIRREPHGADIPILMLTGLQDGASVRQAYEAGATDFADKKSNLAQLPFRIRAMLRAQDTADALRRSETRLRDAQTVAGVGHWEWSEDGGCRNVSGAVLETLGLKDSSAGLTYGQFCELVHEDDRGAVQDAIDGVLSGGGTYKLIHRIKRLDGTERIVEHHGCAAADPGDGTLVVLSTLRDVTEQREAEARARFLSRFDPITGLPNRQHLLEIAAATMREGPSEHAAAFLIANLLDFDVVESTWGSATADQGLRMIADRIVKALSSLRAEVRSFAVGRLNGHRFGIVLTDVSGLDAVTDAARAVQACMARELTIGAHDVRASIAVGIALFPQDGHDPQELLQNAKAAAREVARSEVNGYRFYSADFNVRAARQLDMESSLRRALRREEFVLHYQPRVRFADGRVLGAEALIRWQGEEGRLVPPGEFLPLAEKTGLIVDIGEWALRRACEDARGWRERLGTALDVSVNVSALQLQRGSLPAQVDAALGYSGLPATSLELEVTESALVRDPQTAASILEQVRSRGSRIALDDFGTGYSSLGYLRHLPVDVLKIDRSFVIDMMDKGGDQTLIRAILVLAEGLHLETVAEGIEDASQWQALCDMGCNQAQGYFVARPMPLEAFETWVASWSFAQLVTEKKLKNSQRVTG